MSSTLPGPFNNDDDFDGGFMGGAFPMFPEDLKEEFDDIDWRITRLIGATNSDFNGLYMLVSYAKPPEGFERGYGESSKLRFGIYHAISQEPILTVMGTENVIEWGAIEEIKTAFDYIRQQTILDDLAEA